MSTTGDGMPTGITGLSRDAEIGLAVCPVLFVLLLVGFYIVSRKRQLFCFRRDDVEAQRHQVEVDQFMARLSAANASRSKKEDLAEVHLGDDVSREGLGTQDTLPLTQRPAVLQDEMPQLYTTPSGLTIPPPAYNPSSPTPDLDILPVGSHPTLHHGL